MTVALAGLSLTEVPLLRTLAWTCGIAVLFAVLAALTLLPALTRSPVTGSPAAGSSTTG